MTQVQPPTAPQFETFVQQAIERLNEKLTPDQIRNVASAFRTVQWEFKDLGTTVYLVSDEAIPAIHSAPTIEGTPNVVIGMDSTTLNDAAWGKTSFGAAFITGKLKVKGLNPLKMTKFASMLDPFLTSYREAQEGLNAVN